MTSTNFIDGVTNVAEAAAMGTLVFPDPSRCHTFFDDFDRFFLGAGTTPASQGDWLLTQLTGTTATAAVTNADGGVVAITNSANAGEGAAVQWKGGTSSVVETFSWDSAQTQWFKARFKVSDATNSAFVMGLQITDTTPFAVSDGLYFSKADTATSVSFTAIKTAAGTTTVTGVTTMADDTYVELAFAYLPTGDGMGSTLPVLLIYANDAKVGQITSFTNVPTRTLTLSAAIQNGAAGASTVLSWDYVLCSKTRPQSYVTP